ncbi:unnamed protein product [Echinostoma caproni]|uniref:PLAT domain-containing protein n=1 Tax=Echinostoma caproni TaxID=27848 RepID=A0A183B3G9_9TREM|nr:unnamed protein product [Echinostoma caproni]
MHTREHTTEGIPDAGLAVATTSPVQLDLTRVPTERLGEEFRLTLKDNEVYGGYSLVVHGAGSPGTRKYGIKKRNSSSDFTSEDPSQAREKSYMKADVDTVTVWYTNTFSVRDKWEELATPTQNSVIIAITETWIRHEQDVEKPSEYSTYKQDLVDGRQGGGVLLLVKAA